MWQLQKKWQMWQSIWRSVEAELGKVGGKEDDLEAEADTNTDPQEAKRVRRENGSYFSGNRNRKQHMVSMREHRF